MEEETEKISTHQLAIKREGESKDKGNFIQH